MNEINETTKDEPSNAAASQVERTVMCKFDLNQALTVDWFQGDFGHGDETVLSNKIVKANKEHECHNCSKLIDKGELHRSMSEKSLGEINVYRWCQKCCLVEILSSDGHSAG